MTLNKTLDKKDESPKLDDNKNTQEAKTSTSKEEEISKPNLANVQKIRNKIAKKRYVSKSISPRNRNVMMQPSTSFLMNHSVPVPYPPAVSITYGPAVPVVTTIAPYLHVDIAGYNYPPSNWNSIVTIPNSVYPIAVPTMHVIAPQILTTPVCPYTTIISTPVMTEPVFPQAPSMDSSFEIVSYPSSSYDTPNVVTPSFTQLDPSGYLTLPKDLFLPARMLAVDPNPIIDRFCRESGILGHSPWILDIEFGLPRMPVTRQIATYNSYYNSIHCKNTPGAIHPGFESCSADFKEAILFYYDCVISGWYRGFMMMNYDRSVANFQSWLEIPMQVFGMCWP